MAAYAAHAAANAGVLSYYGTLGLLRTEIALGRPVETVLEACRAHFRPQTAWLLGGPGAGRSTLSARICSPVHLGLGWHHLSTGDLCRAAACEATQEGEELATIMARGDGVPLPRVLELVRRAIEAVDPVGRYVLDGGVRDLEMAVAFEAAFGTPAFIVSLEAPDAVLLARAATRSLSDSGASGAASAASSGAAGVARQQNEHAAVQRKQLADFHASTRPLINLYAQKALVRRVNAARPLEAVWEDVKACFCPRAVFVVGPPGSGKGTQCAALQRASASGSGSGSGSGSAPLLHLCMGDLVRCEVERGSSSSTSTSTSSSALAAHAASGALLPTEDSLALLRAALRSARATGTVLVDGFPRTPAQAAAYNAALGPPTLVLSLEAEEATLKGRLLGGAGGAKEGAAAAAASSFARRYRQYVEGTLGVLDLYGREGRVRAIDASQPPPAVLAALSQALQPTTVYMLGLPGTGKGTQGARLAQAYGYIHLCMGDLVRAEVASGSAVGKRLEEATSQQQLVGDEDVLALLARAMSASGGSRFLLDGFPRSAHQAGALEARCGTPTLVLNFEAPLETLKARLRGGSGAGSGAGSKAAGGGGEGGGEDSDSPPGFSS